MTALVPGITDRPMRDVALTAMSVLCHQAFVEIRASAFTRSVISMSDAAEEEADHNRWVRLLADTCHCLPEAISASMIDEDPMLALQCLQFAWDRSDAVGRRWMRDSLLDSGMQLEEIIDTGMSGTAV